MKVAPLFLTRKAHKTADPILGFDESRSVQYKFLNAKMFYELYFIFIYFDKKACKLSFEVLIGSFYLFLFFRRFNLFFFLEKGREGERGRETLICKRYIGQLPFACPQLGTQPTGRHVR